MKLPDEVEKVISEHFKNNREKHAQVLEQAFQQAVICGQVTIKWTDEKTLEIVNPFKGCGCDEEPQA